MVVLFPTRRNYLVGVEAPTASQQQTKSPIGSAHPSGRYGRIDFLPSEANERLVLADKEQIPEGNFCQVCPRIGSPRREGLGHRPGTFLLRDFDTGFDAGTRSKALQSPSVCDHIGSGMAFCCNTSQITRRLGVLDA
ncbi:MAG: hypothetical protein ACOVSW_24830 [Candidatus Kapaibacteriota bacterium]